MPPTQTHESPYPSTADRHVSWGEMTYHIDLLRDEVRNGLQGVITEIHRGRSIVRWTVGVAVTLSGILSGVIVAIVTASGN